jgi:hypothetical protein
MTTMTTASRPSVDHGVLLAEHVSLFVSCLDATRTTILKGREKMGNLDVEVARDLFASVLRRAEANAAQISANVGDHSGR